MKNIFLRNNNYQFRIRIFQVMQPYFDNKSLYVKSMRTKNKIIATKYAKILLRKFLYIKESILMGLDDTTITNLVYEFTNMMLKDTELSLYNVSNPEDTLFALSLDDTIKKYQQSYQQQNYDLVADGVSSIINNIHGSLSSSDINTISKIMMEQYINNFKLLRDNINSGVYKHQNLDTSITKFISLSFAFDEFCIKRSTWTPVSETLGQFNKNIFCKRIIA